LAAGAEVDYSFNVPAPLGTISATLAFVEGFQIKWFKGGTSEGDKLTEFVVATKDSPFFLSLALAGSDYFLRVKNTGAGGADYILNVTTTPLPPALILFGTALAGLTWLGRRRRSNNAPLQA
jgi:hypothetical protein